MMAGSELHWNEIDRLLKELVRYHQEQLLKSGRRLIPRLTPEDLLQPNDYPELEYNPLFRYEEGIVSGIQTVQTALQALMASRLDRPKAGNAFLSREEGSEGQA